MTTLTAARAPVSERTLDWYGDFLRAHRLLLALGLVVGVLAGLAVQAVKAERFTSGADVVLVSGTTQGSQAGEYRDTTVDSALQQLRSDQVLSPAARRVDYPGGPAELDADLVVRPVINSRIVRLSVSAVTPELARDAVQAVVDALLAERRAAIEAETESRRLSVGGRLAAIAAELDALAQPEPGAEERSRTDPGAGTRTRFLIEQRGYLRAEQAALAAIDPDPGYLAQPPSTPERGTKTGAGVVLASSTALALLLAIGVAGTRERLRKDRR